MSSAYSDKWTLEWERTPWNQIEYRLLWAGFMALGYPKPGSHTLMQPKWGVSWGLLLWFVFCRCHSRTIQTASHCCQQGSLIEYTQTDVKGCDKSASVDRVARGGGKQPHICTQHEHHSGPLTLTGWQAGWDQNTGLQVEYCDSVSACRITVIWFMRDPIKRPNQQWMYLPNKCACFKSLTIPLHHRAPLLSKS